MYRLFIERDGGKGDEKIIEETIIKAASRVPLASSLLTERIMSMHDLRRKVPDAFVSHQNDCRL